MADRAGRVVTRAVVAGMVGGCSVTQRGSDTTYTPRGAAPSRVEALSLLTSHTGLVTE